MPVQPRFLPLPYQDSPESGRLILRDGSTAHIRLATPADQASMLAFFEGLSVESRRRRFSSAALPEAGWIASLCDCSKPRAALTLVVIRADGGEARIVATGSYFAKDDKTAEAAFAVDDDF